MGGVRAIGHGIKVDDGKSGAMFFDPTSKAVQITSMVEFEKALQASGAVIKVTGEVSDWDLMSDAELNGSGLGAGAADLETLDA